MNALTLRNRLRISIVGLVVTIVLALSALNLQSSVQEIFTGAEERAQGIAESVRAYIASNPSKGEKAIRDDALLSQILQESVASSKFIGEVAVVDNESRILASSDAKHVGQIAKSDFPIAEMKHRQTWPRLFQLVSSEEGYAIQLPANSQISARVVVASRLLQSALAPQFRQLVAVVLVSLLISCLIAIVISELVGGSLERIGRDIERISKGENRVAGEQFESEELANLQTKLSLLGTQYQGAREDNTALRGNIEQMVQRLQEAVLLFDPEGCLQTAGPPAERMLAKSRQELIGKSLEEIFPSWTQLGAAIQAAVRLQTQVLNHSVSHARNNLPDAKFLLSVEPVKSSANKPLGTLVTLRDAETRRQLESHLDISSRIASIHRLTSGVAHEIKNPLNAITLHLELARLHVKPDQPQAAAELDIVSKELLRLGRVVNTFLNFSRPMDLQMVECDLGEIVRDTVQPISAMPAVDVDVNTPAVAHTVLADKYLIKKALWNVVTNAVEAMPNGGRLRIGIEKSFEDCVVSVSDSGVGIPADIGERIYNLYFTTKADAAGVGLTETFMAMQLHNGSIEFDSQKNKGTCFRLKFPAIRKS